MGRFTLRVSEELQKQLQERADKHHRSINAEILVLLERFVDSIEETRPAEKDSKTQADDTQNKTTSTAV